MLAAEDGRDPRLKAISDAIRVVPHFPKPGIMFHDITTLLLDHKAFKDTVDLFVERYRDMGISIVAALKSLLDESCVFFTSTWDIEGAFGSGQRIEARGFIFGPSVALGIGAKFVPLRKPGKLPGRVISESYELEYGTDQLEMHVGAVQPGERTIIIDDLVATGGTLSAAIRLLERFQAEVVECACVVGSPVVQGECELKEKPLFVLVEPHH